jgi:predicted dehydrogenase
MSTGPTTVGLVGCGRWGLNVLRDLCALGCKVHVVDPDPAARGRAGSVASVVAELSSLRPCEGYVVATPATTHAEVVRELLGTGRPVFVEKPFTTSQVSADALAEAGAGQVFVMEKWRYHPAVADLRELVRSGALGTVVEVATRRWSTSRSHSDVGAQWTLAPHDLTVLDELVGPVAAVTDATAVAHGGMVERLRATVAASSPASFDVWNSASSSVRSIVVVGAGATARWTSADKDVVEMAGPDGTDRWRRPLPASDPPLLAELREFVEFLRGGPPPRATAAAGARTVALVEQAVQVAGVAGPSGGET